MIKAAAKEEKKREELRWADVIQLLYFMASVMNGYFCKNRNKIKLFSMGEQEDNEEDAEMTMNEFMAELQKRLNQ